jgi:AbrB family looped-hinge helix DNA binding protein
MSITTITKKGQITIPIAIRKHLSLKEKDKLLVKLNGNKATIEKIPSFLELRGSVKTPASVKGLSWKEIEKKAHQAQAEKGMK